MQVPHAPLLVLTAGLVDPEYRFMWEGHPLQKNPAPKSVSLTPPPPFWSSPQGSLIPSASPSSGALTVSFQDRPKCGGLFQRSMCCTSQTLRLLTTQLLILPAPDTICAAVHRLPPNHHFLCTALYCRRLPDWTLAWPVSRQLPCCRAPEPGVQPQPDGGHQ